MVAGFRGVIPGVTPQEIAEVQPELLDFTAEMLGGLPRKDQRAKGELYVRGLLTDGQRKSMQPMAVPGHRFAWWLRTATAT